MVLKIKANVLKTFIKKVTANGLIEDCKLQFKSNGLNVTGKDQPGVILISGVLDKKVFNSYQELEIGIKSSKELISVLTSFKDNVINIVTENNMIRFMEENGGIDLAGAEEITSFKDGIPDLEYNESIIIKKSVIETIIERNNIINSDELKIEIKDKQYQLSIGKEINKANIKEVTTNPLNISLIFDLNYFKKLTMEMDPIIDLYLSNEYPAKFTEKSETYQINYYLTAITEKE